jgi:hypothetical protein
MPRPIPPAAAVRAYHLCAAPRKEYVCVRAIPSAHAMSRLASRAFIRLGASVARHSAHRPFTRRNDGRGLLMCVCVLGCAASATGAGGCAHARSRCAWVVLRAGETGRELQGQLPEGPAEPKRRIRGLQGFFASCSSCMRPLVPKTYLSNRPRGL